MNASNDANYFAQLNAINVSEHIEKKGGFSYLSWPYAVAQLRLADPQATWAVCRFNGLPYLITETGVFVEVAVTVQGVTLSQIHPVLDSRNRPIGAPTAFDINTSIQRCLVKAIALHGLGLYIYAGEDLPMEQGETGGNELPARPVLVKSQPDLDDALDDAFPSSNKVRNLPGKPRDEGLTTAQRRYIDKLIAETGTDEEKLLEYFGFFSLDAIPKSEASRVIKALEGKRKEVA